MTSYASLLKLDWRPNQLETYKPLFLSIVEVASPEQPVPQQQAALQLLNVSDEHFFASQRLCP